MGRLGLSVGALVGVGVGLGVGAFDGVRVGPREQYPHVMGQFPKLGSLSHRSNLP